MGVSEEEEEDGDWQSVGQETHVGEHPLRQAGEPHDHAGRQGEPLVVGDVVVLSPSHCGADVDVEGGGDEDRGGEAEEEQKGEVVHDKLIWLYCASWLDILQKQKVLDLAIQN